MKVELIILAYISMGGKRQIGVLFVGFKDMMNVSMISWNLMYVYNTSVSLTIQC